MIQENKINNLICHLLAIYNYAKDIHYNCKGDNFYGNHLFADRIAENLSEYIDQLKEICLLGNGIKTKSSKDYLQNAIALIPSSIDFKNMANLIAQTLKRIEEIQGASKGDENLLGAIAQDLQNNLGLLNIMFGD